MDKKEQQELDDIREIADRVQRVCTNLQHLSKKIQEFTKLRSPSETYELQRDILNDVQENILLALDFVTDAKTAFEDILGVKKSDAPAPVEPLTFKTIYERIQYLCAEIDYLFKSLQDMKSFSSQKLQQQREKIMNAKEDLALANGYLEDSVEEMYELA